MKKILLFILSFMIFIAPKLKVYANKNNTTLSPYFLIQDGDTSIDNMPLKSTDVKANINGVIADTYVTQVYENNGAKPINATYVFPASTKVSVHGMTMQIGDKIIKAQIKEKEEAKQEFEQAKTEGKSASLLEEDRPNVFTMSIANVMPNDTIIIELHYSELIVPTDGKYQFVFPTVVGPRYNNSDDEANQFVSTPYLKNKTDQKYNITVNLSTPIPIKDLNSNSHKIDVVWESETSANIKLADTNEFAGNRDYTLDFKLSGDAIQSGLMLNSTDTENFFLLTVQPPNRVIEKEVLPREYIFVIDVSGSMMGFPLETSKQLIKNLIGQLKKTDTFNIILFSGLSAKMSDTSLPATDENIKKAMDLLDIQEGGGGTELLPALETALEIPKEDKSRSVVVITDGYISVEKEVFELIKQNISNTNFFSFGIGEGVNHYLIEGIAKVGLGESFIVSDILRSTEIAESFRTYIQSPLLTDVKIKYNGFDAYEVQPEQIPTLFAQRPLIIFGKYRGDATGTIEITGKTGDKDYKEIIDLSSVAPMQENSALPFLWARSKVENISDYGFNDEISDNIKKDVTSIGLKYSMLTPYTSFIAVTEDIRNIDKKSTDVKQPLPLPNNVSEFAVGGYTNGTEPKSIMLVLLFLIYKFIKKYNKKFELRDDKK